MNWTRKLMQLLTYVLLLRWGSSTHATTMKLGFYTNLQDPLVCVSLDIDWSVNYRIQKLDKKIDFFQFFWPLKYSHMRKSSETPVTSLATISFQDLNVV